jgi:hypothetical protein
MSASTEFEIALNSSGYPITRFTNFSGKTPREINTKTYLLTLLRNGFGLNFATFQEFLTTEKAILAGSAALWLVSPWCQYQEFDGDLDIWIQESDALSHLNYVAKPEHVYGYASYAMYHPERQALVKRLTNTFKEQGYQPVIRNGMFPDRNDYLSNVDPNFKYINTIYSFTREIIHRGIYNDPIKRTHKIQVMFLSIPPVEMVRQFDITVTRCFYDGAKLKHFHGSDVNNKTFHMEGNCTDLKRKTKRIEKYERRGFEMISVLVNPEIDIAL